MVYKQSTLPHSNFLPLPWLKNTDSRNLSLKPKGRNFFFEEICKAYSKNSLTVHTNVDNHRLKHLESSSLKDRFILLILCQVRQRQNLHKYIGHQVCFSFTYIKYEQWFKHYHTFEDSLQHGKKQFKKRENYYWGSRDYSKKKNRNKTKLN